MHRAMGWINEADRGGINVNTGWTNLITRIQAAAEQKTALPVEKP
jgi:hypothetical protein